MMSFLFVSKVTILHAAGHIFLVGRVWIVQSFQSKIMLTQEKGVYTTMDTY